MVDDRGPADRRVVADHVPLTLLQDIHGKTATVAAEADHTVLVHLVPLHAPDELLTFDMVDRTHEPELSRLLHVRNGFFDRRLAGGTSLDRVASVRAHEDAAKCAPQNHLPFGDSTDCKFGIPLSQEKVCRAHYSDPVDVGRVASLAHDDPLWKSAYSLKVSGSIFTST